MWEAGYVETAGSSREAESSLSASEGWLRGIMDCTHSRTASMGPAAMGIQGICI